MSEERPLSREDFRRLMSHEPSAECNQLCDELQSITEQLQVAMTEGEKARLLMLISAVRTRMEELHCDPCTLV